MLKKIALAAGLTLATAFSVQAAEAEGDDYPTRPITVVVPFSPGGNVDIIARLINVHLEQRLGESLVVSNVAGASGVIGTGQAARAKPDGYTLMAHSSALVISPSMVADLRYDPLEDFVPLSQITQVPMVLLVSGELGVDTLAEFIEWAKKQERDIDYATYRGSAGHLAGELFQQETGVAMSFVPYKTGSTMAADLIGGRIPSMFDGLFAAASSLATGKVKALAITADERSDFMPDVPTFAELGYPKVNAETWHGYWAPKGTPQPIVDRLSAALAEVTRLPEVKERIVSLGGRPVGSSSAEFSTFTQDEHDRWKALLEQAGVTPQ